VTSTASAFATWPVAEPAPIVELSADVVQLEDLDRIGSLAEQARHLKKQGREPGPTQTAALALWQKSYAWYRRALLLNIPRQFWPATLDEDAPGLRPTAAIRAARKFSLSDGEALVLCGHTGNGKTTAAVGWLREQHGSWTSAAFCHTPKLVRELLDFDTQAEAMHRACDVDLLVLDDLGAHYSKQDGGMTDTLLEELIWYREAHRKDTFITSNLRAAALDARLGDRIADRLRAWAMVHELPGPSLRRKL
jgi:hypothetical protein